MVLVTLGGCHLLDGLVAYDSAEARVEIVRDSRGGLVRGIVLTPRGSRRAILVNLVA
jgi:cobalamin synthase